MPFRIKDKTIGYPEADTYADLPAAGDHTEETYVVLTATGVWGVNRKRTGMWRSDGVNWVRLGVAPTLEQLGGISSDAPQGKKKVNKIYYDPDVSKYTFEREE